VDNLIFEKIIVFSDKKENAPFGAEACKQSLHFLKISVIINSVAQKFRIILRSTFIVYR